jgi:hypothetical protein
MPISNPLNQLGLPSVNPMNVDTANRLESISNAVDTVFGDTRTLDIASKLGAGLLVAGDAIPALGRATENLTTGLSGLGGALGGLIGGSQLLSSILPGGFAGLAPSLAFLNSQGFMPRPNPLSSWANYTYHLRLSMASEMDAYNNIDEENPTLDGVQTIVIAESGVTAGFNIADVQIKFSSGTNNNSKEGWTIHTLEITIKEPLSISFYNRLYSAAQELGVYNHMQCPYFLEIWFNGYDENGLIKTSKKYYQLYRIIFQNVTVVATQVGATYHISAVVDNGVGMMNDYASPPANIIVKATTLGEYFDKLTDGWNKAILNVNQDKLQRIKYTITLPDYMRQWKLKNPDVNKQNARNAPMDAPVGTNATDVTAARGQAIESIIRYAVSNTLEWDKWVSGQDSPSQGGASLKENGMVRLFAVYPKVLITGYGDKATNNYIRDITYYIIPHEHTSPYVDIPSMQQAATSGVTQAKINYLSMTQRLVKEYDYIYTGLNTEVLQFDIKLQNLWTMQLPSWTQSNSYDQYTQGPLIDPNSFAWLLQKQTLNKTPLSAGQTPANVDAITPGTDLGSIGSAVSPLYSPFSALSGVVNGIGGVVNGIGGVVRNITSGVPILGALGSVGEQVLDAALNQVLPDNGATNLIEAAINGLFGTVKQQYLESIPPYNASDNFSQTFFPITGIFPNDPTQQTTRQNTDQNKVPNQKDPTQQPDNTGLAATVMNNIFSAPQFNTISMLIRGDPWWLPIGNIKLNALAAQQVQMNGVAQTAAVQDNANYLGGVNQFVLNIRAGVIIDENTGLAKRGPAGAEFWSGFYNVMGGEAMFSKGKFTMRLTASRDTTMSNSPSAASDTEPAAGVPSYPYPANNGVIPNQSNGNGIVPNAGIEGTYTPPAS